jgi:hypothetical protein
MIHALACAAAWAGAVDSLPSVVGEPSQPPEDALLGDLDGDGASELVVAVPAADDGGHEAGALAWVASPNALAPLSRLADEAMVVLIGEAPQDRAGTSLVLAGDLDGDGYADLAVGAPEATTVEALVAGKVYVVYGGAAPDRSTASLGDADAANGIDRLDGGTAWGRVGHRVFAAGDRNDDGVDDLLVGAPVPTPDGATGSGWLGLVAPIERGAGGVLAFAPAETPTQGLAAVWTVAGTETLAGRSAAVIPDRDGDGRDDLVLGAPGVGRDEESEATRGAAFVFAGAASDALSPPQTQAPIFDDASAVATIVGRELGDAFPWSIEALGNHVLFAVPEEDSGRGAVYSFSSLGDGTTSTADRAVHGAAQGDLFGRGAADARALGAFLLVGAPGAGGGIGAVLLTAELDGAAGVGTVALGSIDGCWTDGQLGHTVRGTDEGAVAITAPFASVYGATDGVAAILDPSRLDALDAPCMHGDATIPDADGDGAPASLDCDDEAAWRHPDAVEVCGDDVDDDCDDQTDEDCGPPPPDLACPGCTSSPGHGIAAALLAWALVRRRSRVLLLVSFGAQAHELDALEAADHRLWGSASNESLHGPVIDVDGALAVANFQGIHQAFAVGEVALVAREGLAADALLAGAAVTLHGSSEHDYFGVAVAAEGAALFVGIDHSGLTENDPGEVALFRDPWDGHATPADADVRLTGEHAGDSFGTVLDLGGDLDGDGSRDLVVGAPTFSYGRDVPERPTDCDDWTAPPLLSGAVYVVHDAAAALAGDGPIAVREDCAPGAVSNESIATAVIQAPDLDEATFFGARVVATDLDGDGYGDLFAASWDADTSGTVSFFPGPISAGDLDLERHDAAGTLRTGNAGSFTGWSLAGSPDGSALAVGSQDAHLWIVADPPSGSVDLGEPTATGDPGSGFATALAWGPALLVGAPFADEVHVLDGESFSATGVLHGAPSLGSWVGWIPSLESDLPDAVLTAPAASRNLSHQGVALVIDGRRALEGDAATNDTGCGCASAPAAPYVLLAILALASRGRRPAATRC